MKNGRSSKPRKVVVYYRDIPHCLDLVACRKALVRRQVEGKFHAMDQLAVAVGCSRSTASRFFSGRNTSLETALRVVAQLGVRFDDVATPCTAATDCRDGA